MGRLLVDPGNGIARCALLPPVSDGHRPPLHSLILIAAYAQAAKIPAIMKAAPFLLALFVSLAAPLTAQDAKPTPEAEKLKKLAGIATWSKAQQAYDEGLKFFQQAKGDEAIAKFTEALSHIDKFTDARLARGRTYYEMHRYEPALEDYNRVVAERPEDANGHYQRGLALWNLKKRDEALKAFDTAIQKKPRTYAYHDSRAMLLESMKQQAKALADYDMMVALQPLTPSNLERRGRLLKELGRNEEAEEDERQGGQLRDAGF